MAGKASPWLRDVAVDRAAGCGKEMVPRNRLVTR